MNTTGWLKGLQITADGTGIVSHAGVALLRAPLRDLLYERRAAPGRRGHARRRRRLRHLARQGRDQDQRGRPLLGGRGRRPGLPPALPRRQESVQSVAVRCGIAALDEEEPPGSSRDALLLRATKQERERGRPTRLLRTTAESTRVGSDETIVRVGIAQVGGVHCRHQSLMHLRTVCSCRDRGRGAAGHSGLS